MIVVDLSTGVAGQWGAKLLAMGGAVREWTASDVAPVEKVQNKAAAVRGARGDASGVDHRCAHRAAIDAELRRHRRSSAVARE